jgi:hypothetical protein
LLTILEIDLSYQAKLDNIMKLLFIPLILQTIMAKTTSSYHLRSRNIKENSARNTNVTTPSLEQTSEVKDFVTLECNEFLHVAYCNPWSSHFGTDDVHTSRIIIQCGECILMDHPGDMLVLEDGIDIHGKLVFPENNGKLTVKSPFVTVQGELEIHATNKVLDGDFRYKFEMTGEESHYLEPIEENADACKGKKCKVGKKVIVVAGGKINGE